MAMSLYLFAALLMSAGTVMASNNPSGLWNISYEVQWGSAESQLANSSVASITSRITGRRISSGKKGWFLIALSAAPSMQYHLS
jgi:hypothetical protein